MSKEPKQINQKLDRAAHWVAERGLEAPVLFLLELHKPLGGLMHNGAIFLQPIGAPFFGTDKMAALRQLFESEENIEHFMQLIESYSLAQRGKKLKN